jgi:transcriptional regulator with XRE-family HTH domain
VVRAPSTFVGAEIRRLRHLCHLRQARLAELSGVASTTSSEIERGRRLPSVGTHVRLPAALGLVAAPTLLLPNRKPATVTDAILRHLCATVVATKRSPLGDLASALDIAFPACREPRSMAAPHFREFGSTATEDGVEFALGYAEHVVGVSRPSGDSATVRALAAQPLSAPGPHRSGSAHLTADPRSSHLVGE